MLSKFISKSILVATAFSLSVACVQMKPEDSGVQSTGSSGSSVSGGSKKSFNTKGFLNSKRTPSGRIAIDFSDKRTIDVSNIVNDPDIATVEATNEGGTFARYESGAPFKTTVKSSAAGGTVIITVTFNDGSKKTYRL